MHIFTSLCFLAFLTVHADAASSLEPLALSIVPPSGLKMEYPADSGVTLLGLHYSINTPLQNVASGQWNVDVNSKTGNSFVHINTKVNLKPGDKVYYWYLVVQNGRGAHKLNLEWTVPEPTTTSTTPKSTTKTTTHKPEPGNHTTHSTTPSTPRPAPPQPSDGNCTCRGGNVDPAASCTSYPCLIFEDNFDDLDHDKWEHEITASGGGNWEFQYYLNNRSNTYTRNGKLFIKPTLTADSYSEQFLMTGTLDIWGTSPPNLCTGGMSWGCERTGNGAQIVNPIQSGRLRSIKAFNFKYGKVEVEAKMPSGDWLWPAIWMLPKQEKYGLWPASGEIDIVESRGNSNLRDNTGKPIGNNWMGSTLHWGPFFAANSWERTHKELVASSGSFASSFHKYEMEWDENGITTHVDGQEVLNVSPGKGGFWEFGDFAKRFPGINNPWANNTKMTPFDQDFYLVMNVAVGGINFFPDDGQNQGGAKPWNNKSPTASRDFWNARGSWYPTWNPKKNNGEDAALQVNYVKVYKMKPNK